MTDTEIASAEEKKPWSHIAGGERWTKRDWFLNHKTELITHPVEAVEWEGRLACQLIERWGIVAAAPDGEDSSGRAKLRVLTPAELVETACDTAQLAVAELRKRGWVTPIPSLEEIFEQTEK